MGVVTPSQQVHLPATADIDCPSVRFRRGVRRPSSFRIDALPDALQEISPSDPSTLERGIQSRTICQARPPTLAAPLRLPPSRLVSAPYSLYGASPAPPVYLAE